MNASEDERKQMVIMCEFVMPEFDIVDLDFWFTSSSDRAIDFLEDFTKIEKNLGALLNFQYKQMFKCVI